MSTRILLVEDDATSAAFLVAAMQSLPATVDVAGSVASARVAAEQHDYRLWLIDANLPDGSGAGLLHELRASGRRAAAVAHTAAHDRHSIDVLVDAGFDEVLVKPLTTAQLHAVIRRVLGMTADTVVASPPGSDLTPIWDDTTAAAALKGSLANVQALRTLFLRELPQLRGDATTALARGDVAALHRVLHKLRASCGFVGARRLDAAVRCLQDAPGSQAAFARFSEALQETLSSD